MLVNVIFTLSNQCGNTLKILYLHYFIMKISILKIKTAMFFAGFDSTFRYCLKDFGLFESQMIQML